MATLYYTTGPELTSVAHAIRQKGQTDEALTYPEEFISAIQAIPAPEIEPKEVNLYDYDGTVVASYTAEEFAALEAFPPAPAHDGLTFQGWNWELAAAQTYVGLYGVCEIGAMYIPSDGATKAVIDIGESERLTVYVRFTASAAEAVTVDFGDETEPVVNPYSGANELTHTYESAGRYVISLSVASGATCALGKNAVTAFDASDLFIGQGTGCSGSACVKALYIGNGVNELKTNALCMFTNLKEITIPETCTTFGVYALESCMKLRALVLPKGMTAMPAFALRASYALEVLCLPSSLAGKMGEGAVMSCVAVRRVTIPTGVNELGRGCFERCFAAELIQVPNTVTNGANASDAPFGFGDNCFRSCYELKSINIPQGIKYIPSFFADSCHCLREITLPAGLLHIRNNTFAHCFALASLTIPASVVWIYDFAFLFSDGAAEIHMLGTTPPSIEAHTFTETGADLTIYVPYSANHSVLNAYKAAANWSAFADHIVEEAQ